MNFAPGARRCAEVFIAVLVPGFIIPVATAALATALTNEANLAHNRLSPFHEKRSIPSVVLSGLR